MISKEEAYLDFLVECKLHKEQQESYRMSLQAEGIYSVAEPCCPRFYSWCFEDYYDNLIKYSNGEGFNWRCVFNGNEVFYTKGKDKDVSIEEVRTKCKELGIDLD